ncbi:MAG: D-aminoacyl-tRNA deacylase, partial [Solirubrobacterales bacterium]
SALPPPSRPTPRRRPPLPFRAFSPPPPPRPLYELVCDRLGAQRGEFGASMAVELVNDGPVTIVLDG